MWIDESDTTELAQRLRVGPRELIEAIGGPWHASWRIPDREAEAPGTLFIGRAGPCVAVLVDDGPDPRVTVGRAVGEWAGPATLQWSIDEVEGRGHVPPVDAPSGEVDALLVDLRRLVEDAFAAARRSLVLCRYCGSLVAPVHASAEDCCSGCGSTLFGIVS